MLTSTQKKKNNPSFAKKSSTGVHMEKTIQLGHPAEPGHTIIRVVGQATVHLIYTTSQTWSGRSWHPVGQWEDGNDGNVNVYVCVRVCVYIYSIISRNIIITIIISIIVIIITVFLIIIIIIINSSIIIVTIMIMIIIIIIIISIIIIIVIIIMYTHIRMYM